MRALSSCAVVIVGCMEPNPRANMAMNRLIASRRSITRSGLIDRLTGATPLTDNRQESFNRAVASYEGALRRGAEEEAAVWDHRIDAILDESRAERRAALVSNVGQSESAAPAPTPQFGGGVRGRRPVAGPRHRRQPETSRELFARAMLASHLERAERIG